MIKAVTATILSAVIAVTSVVPAGATSIFIGGYSAPIETVQYRDRRHWDRPGYWHGHRGYRHHRPGYRRHSDGWWYPLAAFGLGSAIIGGIARPRLGPSMPVNHVRWCQGRYRSYDPRTNTFQPYHGPRRICVSPYYR
ncbi:BA14K family protein [Pleomorphomonas sp. JP5]|uniref:BA14K family protein n=1 Tax=Pleomorphomonas sp. JP5 TaxID=2942998 RepID=UPI0028800502|nr:BA14K family protein [Pleomorphomonas sp. JP5]